MTTRQKTLGAVLVALVLIAATQPQIDYPNQVKRGPVIMVESYGCKGDGTTNDQACVQAAINAVQGTGGTLVMSKTYRLNSDVNITSANFTIDGQGTGVIKRSASSGTVYALNFQLGGSAATGTTVTGNVNGGFSGRAVNSTNVIPVTSTSGISVGTWLKLVYNDPSPPHGGFSIFNQFDRVVGISSLNVTLSDAVTIPIITSQSNTVLVTTFQSNLNIRGLTIDGSLLSGTFNGGGVEIHGCLNCTFTNDTVQNFPSGSGSGTDKAAWHDFESYGEIYRGIRGINAGRHNGDWWWESQTNIIVDDVIGISNNASLTDTAGPDIHTTTTGQFSNFHTSGYTSRCTRLILSDYIQFTNLSMATCNIGMFVTWDTYRVQMRNVIANGMLNGGVSQLGMAISGNDESFIEIDGFVGWNNNQDIFVDTLTPTGHDIRVKNYSGSQWTGIGSTHPIVYNSTILYQGTTAAAYSVGCTGTAPSSSTIVIDVNPGGPCAAVTNFDKDYIQLNRGGMIHDMYVTATTGGVNSSSGVVSLVIAGVGTTIISCTLGTGTSCNTSGDSTHTSPQIWVNPGSLGYIQFTTQALETLNGVHVSFQIN